ncbi:MAG: glycosyltransferase family 2 protein [Verrucomicrobiota bacterium]
MTPAPQPAVSILIVNYNGAHLLRDCLDSLAKVTQPSFEIVVVDNASQDASLAVLRNYPTVRVVKSPTNCGFAGGNNLGLPHCTGRYLLLLNSDTIVTPDFLTPLCEHLDRYPQVGIAQSRMILPNHGGRLDSCGSFLTRIGFMYHRGFLKPDAPLYHQTYRVFTAKGACMLIRRETIVAAGGYLFDEDFFCYYDETDFCHRAWLAGHESHFLGHSVIQHLMGATSESSQKKSFVMSNFLRNQIYSLFSNLELGSLLRIMPLYFLFFFASLFAALLTGKWPLVRAHAHGLWANLKCLSKIRKQRTLIRQIRKLRDRELFQMVLVNPRLDYFIKTFQGRIGDYQDEALPPR